MQLTTQDDKLPLQWLLHTSIIISTTLFVDKVATETVDTYRDEDSLRASTGCCQIRILADIRLL